mmetsp:Transcript_31086/g.101576  ORF Transcript_31086/g.101576 Transcript_31086/m.101576 type:complete len:451 (-) Transcript_31086:230-1582(-)
MASRIGRVIFHAAVSPDGIRHGPRRAPRSPPDVPHPMNRMPCSASAACRRSVFSNHSLPQSTTTSPARSSGESLASTASTGLPAGTRSMMVRGGLSALTKADADVKPLACRPSRAAAASSADTLAGSVSKPATASPRLSARLRRSCDPITPSPTTPTRISPDDREALWRSTCRKTASARRSAMAVATMASCTSSSAGGGGGGGGGQRCSGDGGGGGCDAVAVDAGGDAEARGVATAGAARGQEQHRRGARRRPVFRRLQGGVPPGRGGREAQGAVGRGDRADRVDHARQPARGPPPGARRGGGRRGRGESSGRAQAAQGPAAHSEERCRLPQADWPLSRWRGGGTGGQPARGSAGQPEGGRCRGPETVGLLTGRWTPCAGTSPAARGTVARAEAQERGALTERRSPLGPPRARYAELFLWVRRPMPVARASTRRSGKLGCDTSRVLRNLF